MNVKTASEAYYGFLAENEEQFDRIYDDLVKVRTEIATKLGFKNFVELGYVTNETYDYNAEMVANFRKQVKNLSFQLQQIKRTSKTTHWC